MQTSIKSLLLKSGFIAVEAAMIHTNNWNKFYKKNPIIIPKDALDLDVKLRGKKKTLNY